MKNTIEKIKTAIDWLLLTHLGRLLIGFLGLVFSVWMSTVREGALWEYSSAAFAVYLSVYVLLFVVAGFVGMWRDWKDQFK